MPTSSGQYKLTSLRATTSFKSTYISVRRLSPSNFLSGLLTSPIGQTCGPHVLWQAVQSSAKWPQGWEVMRDRVMGWLLPAHLCELTLPHT